MLTSYERHRAGVDKEMARDRRRKGERVERRHLEKYGEVLSPEDRKARYESEKAERQAAWQVERFGKVLSEAERAEYYAKRNAEEMQEYGRVLGMRERTRMREGPR